MRDRFDGRMLIPKRIRSSPTQPGLPLIERSRLTVTPIATFFWKIREIFVILGAYLAYMFARKVILGDIESVAFDNASKLVSFQEKLGVLLEPHWQSWVIDHVSWAAIALNWAYFMTFVPIIALTAVILYFKDRSRYLYYRNVIMLSFVVALLVFILFPLAPPRLLPGFMIDTIATYGPSQYGGREMAWFYNVYAAMPSLHFGWTILIGALFFNSSGTKLFKVLGVAYPTLTFFAITITGNHYILDAVGGAGVAMLSYLVYEGLRRWRRSNSFQALWLKVKGRRIALGRGQSRRRPKLSPWTAARP